MLNGIHITAAIKGLLTGLVMIGITLLLFYTRQPFNSLVQYSIYAIYLAGIIWSLTTFSKSVNHQNTFGKYFLEGFKCFVVVTLLMVVFTFIFNKLHPEFKDELSVAYKQELINNGNSTPMEIDKKIIDMKGNYLTILISRTIFAYLFLGAVITAAASLIFIRRK